MYLDHTSTLLKDCLETFKQHGPLNFMFSPFSLCPPFSFFCFLLFPFPVIIFYNPLSPVSAAHVYMGVVCNPLEYE